MLVKSYFFGSESDSVLGERLQHVCVDLGVDGDVDSGHLDLSIQDVLDENGERVGNSLAHSTDLLAADLHHLHHFLPNRPVFPLILHFGEQDDAVFVRVGVLQFLLQMGGEVLED